MNVDVETMPYDNASVLPPEGNWFYSGSVTLGGATRQASPERKTMEVVASTALATAAAFTFTQFDSDTRAYSDFSITRLDQPVHAPRTVIVHQHLLEAYSEMQSYRSLAAGWDGLGSVAPSVLAIASALGFLTSLPATSPAPEPGATADGDVEWYWESEKGIATVSFSGTRITHFGQAGQHTSKGSASYDGRGVPADLLRVIASI